MSTANKALCIWGDKPYQERARIVLPILVRQAYARKTLTYQQLAYEMNIHHRNLNYILGAIGKTIIEINEQYSMNIPPIQSLVVNKKTRLPGEGIDWFLSKNDISFFKQYKGDNKKKIISHIHDKVFEYQYWDKVLKLVDLKKLEFYNPMKIPQKFQGGEGKNHKSLKEFIAKNPSVLGISKKCKVTTEKYLPSGDYVDVFFKDKKHYYAVEVKSSISNKQDIERGLFQCVKYKAVTEAKLRVEGKKGTVVSYLVLETALPTELIPLKNMLGVEVFENIKIS